MADTKADVENMPFHMQMDGRRRNENIDKGNKLCKRCEGTGNQLFSMYQKCEHCDGTGIMKS